MEVQDTRWGSYTVLKSLDGFPKYKVKELCINNGAYISLQYHQFRSEYWTVVRGSGIMKLNDKVFNIKVGDLIFIPEDARHQVKGVDNLTIIEVQLGSEVEESDIIRLSFECDF